MNGLQVNRIICASLGIYLLSLQHPSRITNSTNLHPEAHTMFPGKRAANYSEKEAPQEETPLMRNGRMLLQERISFGIKSCNPIKIFSAEEIMSATSNYCHKRVIEQDTDYVLYKGFLSDRPVTIKSYRTFGGFRLNGSPITDIVIGSQMSNHKNVLKIIGCCLDNENPELVYEYAGNDTLSRYLSRFYKHGLSWKHRKRIALGVANAIAYLHNGLPRPVIHRDIGTSVIIIAEGYEAKLIDFSLSVAIPNGESHVVDVIHAISGYSAPEYIRSSYLTEKVDVYCFGMLLLQLLAGEKQGKICCFEPGDLGYLLPNHVNHFLTNKSMFTEMVDLEILHGRVPEAELLEFGMLAVNCLHENSEDRPTMIDVAKELKRISQSTITP